CDRALFDAARMMRLLPSLCQTALHPVPCFQHVGNAPNRRELPARALYIGTRQDARATKLCRARHEQAVFAASSAQPRSRALVPPSRHGTCIAKLAAAVLEVSWPSMPACNSNDNFNEPDLASGIGSALRDRSHGE